MCCCLSRHNSSLQNLCFQCCQNACDFKYSIIILFGCIFHLQGNSRLCFPFSVCTTRNTVATVYCLSLKHSYFLFSRPQICEHIFLQSLMVKHELDEQYYLGTCVESLFLNFETLCHHFLKSLSKTQKKLKNSNLALRKTQKTQFLVRVLSEYGICFVCLLVRFIITLFFGYIFGILQIILAI